MEITDSELVRSVFKERRLGLGGAGEEQSAIRRRERHKWNGWDGNWGFGEAFEGWNGTERGPI